MSYKNLLILGATGNIGRLVLNDALERGYKVTVVVRAKEKVQPHAQLTIIEGSVLDASVLTHAMKGQDAVISCLGILRKNQQNPWSTVISPQDFTASVIKNTLSIMHEHGVKRLIA
ncbi:MAG: NAD(P)H-binding protein, partial [Pseudomonadales bacterium]|nr:NAD(P)H-binding protein [Pseudomonadales bacterium]